MPVMYMIHLNGLELRYHGSGLHLIAKRFNKHFKECKKATAKRHQHTTQQVEAPFVNQTSRKIKEIS